MTILDDFNFNITIVGLGLIGGSYAMALRKLGPRNIWAVDIDENAIKDAENRQIIDKGYTNPRIPLSKSDIVIMCVYPELIYKITEDNIEYFKRGCIITDVAGVKSSLVDRMKGILRDDMDYIGGHPMAGREYKGLEHAKDDLFVGANYILTPTPMNRKYNIEVIKTMIDGLGCKNILSICAKEHDEIMAHTSQLPHITAAALMEGMDENTHLFVAGSFKDATRVARLNGKLWAELIIDNQENSIKKLDILLEYLNSIRDMIEGKDYTRLEARFDEACKRREEFVRRCAN